MRTTLTSSGAIPFNRAGYDTHFVYGGKLGWRDLGQYLKAQNFTNLHGADEIKAQMPELNKIEARDLGNEWGIFDEYLYSFIEKTKHGHKTSVLCCSYNFKSSSI